MNDSATKTQFCPGGQASDSLAAYTDQTTMLTKAKFLRKTGGKTDGFHHILLKGWNRQEIISAESTQKLILWIERL